MFKLTAEEVSLLCPGGQFSNGRFSSLICPHVLGDIRQDIFLHFAHSCFAPPALQGERVMLSLSHPPPPPHLLSLPFWVLSFIRMSCVEYSPVVLLALFPSSSLPYSLFLFFFSRFLSSFSPFSLSYSFSLLSLSCSLPFSAFFLVLSLLHYHFLHSILFLFLIPIFYCILSSFPLSDFLVFFLFSHTLVYRILPPACCLMNCCY